MFPTRPQISAVPDLVRLAVCLLHAVPQAVGVLEATGGSRHLVARHHRDADLTPCQLRAALLEPVEPGVPHLSRVIESLEVVAGVVDLGGGLLQVGHPSVSEQRWFATTLPFGQVRAMAADAPADIDSSDVSVRVVADVDLGTCAVCVSADRGGLHLDAAACWLHARCLVEELLLVVEHPG